MRYIHVAALALAAASLANAQSLGSAGTVTGTVKDPQGAFVPNAAVQIVNSITSYQAKTVSDASGAFRLSNIPPNKYKLQITAAGFLIWSQDIDVRSTVPQTIAAALQLGTQTQSMEVEASGAMVETDPSAHTDIDRAVFNKLPMSSPGSGLSDIITYSTGGVAADANGSFHPLGDHGQVTLVVDGQPISDQQSKFFSTQLPPNALQSMELVTGSADAEFGDKTSLVVNSVSRSGLGAKKAFGNIESNWASFGTWAGNASVGFGTERFGNFLAIDGARTGRFLDTPEFLPIHDTGNNERIFDRMDYQPNDNDTFHLNLFVARNGFQVPNTYDQLSQDQRQRVLSWNVAPGYQHTFNANTLLTLNAFARRDQVDYYGSRNPLDDTPAAVNQRRFLTNYGLKGDVSWIKSHHEVKAGFQIQQTRLSEQLALGITDPFLNPICLDASGAPRELPSVTNPSFCGEAGPGFQPNPNVLPGIIPYDLTRGGTEFNFQGRANINSYAVYVQDRITLGDWTVNVGLRDDQYNGLTSANGVQPRIGISYHLPHVGTVFRAAYSRTFETPFNENLILSNATGGGGLAQNVFGATEETAIRPGSRNQFNAGFQQRLGSFAVFDGDYFWKFTKNAYDFDVLYNTPITFPISWHNSKIDGFTARLSTVQWHGFQSYVTMGHSRSRFFPPEVGGLIPQSPLADTVFRIDHDQAFQQTTNLRYQRPNNGEFAVFVWRYDSGMVSGAVPDMATALGLTGAQQAAIGLQCGDLRPSPGNAITSCDAGATVSRLVIPEAGTANDDHNPPRIAPRNLFDVSFGTDNLLHKKEGQRITLALSIVNLTNKAALYNFLSTFSGTHFVQPRTYQVKMGWTF